MKRRVELEMEHCCDIDNSHSIYCVVTVAQSRVLEIAAEFIMLKMSLVEALTLDQISGPLRIRFTLKQDSAASQKKDVEKHGTYTHRNNQYEVQLSDIQVDYMAAFLLEWHRDKYCAVDHVDAEFIAAKNEPDRREMSFALRVN